MTRHFWLVLPGTILVGTILAFTLIARSAVTEPAVCSLMPMRDIVGALATRYDEMAVGLGIIGGSKGVATVFVSPSGTWTIVLSDDQARGCVIAVGTDWTIAKAGDPA